MEEQVQNVKWLDYSKNMMDIQKSVFISSSMFDVVIAAGEIRFKAHQLVLSACSDFFVEILRNYPPHLVPTIIIPDLNAKLVEPLLVFMYTGEAYISSNAITDFLDVCNFLRIKGLNNHDYFIDGVRVERKIPVKEEQVEIMQEDTDEKCDGSSEETIIPTIEPEYQEDDYSEDNTNVDDQDDVIFEKESNQPMEEYLVDIEEEPTQIEVETEEFIEKPDISPQKLPVTKFINKPYTDQNLMKALEDLKSGCTVIKVADKHNIPKSTIYMKLRQNPEYRVLYRSIRNTIIEDAVRAVTLQGISLKEASEKFNLSKTVLWRKLKQSSLYKPEERSHAFRNDALEAMERGETLISISRKFNIPLSTLHRDKVRLFTQGKLPENCKLTKRDSGPGYKKRLRAAVKCCEDGMTQKLASELHGVPKTTIWRHLQRASKSATAESEFTGDAEQDDGEEEKYPVNEDEVVYRSDSDLEYVKEELIGKYDTSIR